MASRWTFADFNIGSLDISGPQCELPESGPKTSRIGGQVGYAWEPSGSNAGIGRKHEFGLANLFAGAAVARSALRRKILYWRDWEPGVLPTDLPGADGEREKLPVFSDGRCSGGGRVSSMPALPARGITGNSGVAGNLQHGFTGAAADRGIGVGRRGGGSSGRAAGSWFAASKAVVPATFGSHADRRGADAAVAFR